MSKSGDLQFTDAGLGIVIWVLDNSSMGDVVSRMC